MIIEESQMVLLNQSIIKIKTLIKTSNGIKSFDRLRNKIMYSINKDIPIKSK